VRIVVADTGPLRYLALIDAVDLLPRMYGKVLIPEIVRFELTRDRTPQAVRAWISTSPAWLEPHPTPSLESLPHPLLDDGERAAIALAQAEGATLILMDDRAGVAAARAEGFEVSRTLAVLIRAAQRGLVDLAAAFSALRATNFRYPPDLMDDLLSRYEAERNRTVQ
jgi:predicted nucleic acid-binding protein